ncbi:hypothetical protein ACS0TY_003232 [Phlomoides rotata]
MSLSVILRCLKEIYDEGSFGNVTSSMGQREYNIMQGEDGPHRLCKSKSFIPKVMLICLVARPQYACDGASSI